MNTSRVLGGALRLLQRRRVLGLGIVIALIGLVYAAILLGLSVYNPNYLAELSASITPDLPSALPFWIVLGALVLLLGGLVSEGGLILAAGRRAAARLSGPGGQPVRAAWRRLPHLVLVGLLVWWPVLLGLALTLAPSVYWATVSQDDTVGWGLTLLGSGCCAGLVFVAGWLLLWPQQRLANCALLLAGVAPRAAVQTARRLFFGRFGAVFGLWTALLLLNVVLLVVSVLLATLAAGLVTGIWSLLGAAPQSTALWVAGAVAALLAVGLLAWDGAVSAFNLNTWVLTYLDLQAEAGTLAGLTAPLGTTQLLGRHRADEC
jgi:hypothetical protein